MARSARDLREFICLSRFGFRPDENASLLPSSPRPVESSRQNLLFYFDPSILNNWLELTSARLDRLRTVSTCSLIDFFHFWLRQFENPHKKSLFQMEFELFVEHLLLAFTPNDTDPSQINEFARQVLHDIDEQLKEISEKNDRNFLQMIDIFNRCQRDDSYRTLLANIPALLTENNDNRLHLQWILAIRAFGLVAICSAAFDFFEKIQKTLEKSRPTPNVDHRISVDFTSQTTNRILTALRKEYLDVLDYFLSTNQILGNSLDEQNRNILFHALPFGNTQIIERLIESNLPQFDIDSSTQSGNSLAHVCVTLQRIDLLQLLHKFYPKMNLNIRNHQDATPLHLAIIYDDLPIARFLLQAGADRTLKMKTKTSIDLIREFSRHEFLQLFDST